jgi:ribonuclease PH
MTAANASQTRPDGRRHDELRPLRVQRHFTGATPGSTLIEAGRTVVLCTASVAPEVPPWLEGQNRGWLTAEYSMLPGSTSPRKPRDRAGKIDGRTTEIQRLIGRSLRAVVDLTAIPGQMITVDCDVLQADGGTRTASITGAWIALVDAVEALQLEPHRPFFRSNVAAVSVGIVQGAALLDLDYREDALASVDMNVVMTGGGRFVEVQGTGEEATFSEAELASLLGLARQGIQQLTRFQREALGDAWRLIEPA